MVSLLFGGKSNSLSGLTFRMTRREAVGVDAVVRCENHLEPSARQAPSRPQISRRVLAEEAMSTKIVALGAKKKTSLR